jgi:hypothetical protein
MGGGKKSRAIRAIFSQRKASNEPEASATDTACTLTLTLPVR